MLQKVKFIDGIVFMAALFTVGIVFYEGLVQKQLEVPLEAAIYVLDYSFIIAVILHFICDRRNKVALYFNIFNTILILAAFGIKFMNGIMPAFSILFWDFYIMLYFGVLVLRNILHKFDRRK